VSPRNAGLLGDRVGINIDTGAVRAAVTEFSRTVLPIVEDAKNLVDQYTGMSKTAWGAVGMVAVSGSYDPVREYQQRQLADFERCMHGIVAGLHSVALHYDKVELENARKSYDAAKGKARTSAEAKMHELEAKVRKSTEDFNMAKSQDDSYH
jgi:hypothetical protein